MACNSYHGRKNFENPERRRSSYLCQANAFLRSLQEISSERSHLETQEQRNAALEKDVQAYMERKEIEQQIDLLELLLPFKEYLDSRKEYERLRTLRETLHEKALRLQRRNEPVRIVKE